MIQIKVNLTDELLEKVEDFRKSAGISRSEAIRELLAYAFRVLKFPPSLSSPPPKPEKDLVEILEEKMRSGKGETPI